MNYLVLFHALSIEKTQEMIGGCRYWFSLYLIIKTGLNKRSVYQKYALRHRISHAILKPDLSVRW